MRVAAKSIKFKFWIPRLGWVLKVIFGWDTRVTDDRSAPVVSAKNYLNYIQSVWNIYLIAY